MSYLCVCIIFLSISLRVNGDATITINPLNKGNLSSQLSTKIVYRNSKLTMSSSCLAIHECDSDTASSPVMLRLNECFYLIENCRIALFNVTLTTGNEFPVLNLVRSGNGGEINVIATCRNGGRIIIDKMDGKPQAYDSSIVQLRWITERLSNNEIRYLYSLYSGRSAIDNQTTWDEKWKAIIKCSSSALPTQSSGGLTSTSKMTMSSPTTKSSMIPNPEPPLLSSISTSQSATGLISTSKRTMFSPTTKSSMIPNSVTPLLSSINTSQSATVSAPAQNTTQEIVSTTKQLTGNTVSNHSTTTDCRNCYSNTAVENTKSVTDVANNSMEEVTKPSDGKMLITYIISGSISGVLLLFIIIIAAIYARKRYRLSNEKNCNPVITSPEIHHRPMLGEQTDPTYSHLGDRVPNKRYQLTDYESHDIPIYGCHQNNNVYHELERPTFCGQDNSNSESDGKSSIYSTISDSNLAQSADRPATQEKINTDNDTAVNRIFGAGSEKAEEKPQLHVEEETKRRVVRDLYSQVTKPHPKNNATENIEIEMIENDIYEPTKREDDEF